VGDVWLCSGQSNMAFGLGACSAHADIKAADFPSIRYLSYWENFASEPQEDANLGSWNRVSPESAGGCSGVAFYFGRRIYSETKVPIGLLLSSVGGTEIECWMPPEAFSNYPANAAIGKRLQDAVDEYKRSIPAAVQATEEWLVTANKALADKTPVPDPPRFPLHPNVDRSNWVRIQSLYNGMIHPLTPFAIRGAIWYQGERLALWALKNDYGKTRLVCSGPLYKSMKIEGSRIRIYFDSVGSGLWSAEKTVGIPRYGTRAAS